MSNNNKLLCSTVFGINMLTVDFFQVPTVLISKITIFPNIFNSSSSFFANTREIAEQKRLLISAEAEITNKLGLPKFNVKGGLALSYACFPVIQWHRERVLIRLEASPLHFLDSFLMLFTSWSYGTEWVTLSLELLYCLFTQLLYLKNCVRFILIGTVAATINVQNVL